MMQKRKLYYPQPPYQGRRRTARYKLSIKVAEVEGRPEGQTSIIDISPQGAQLETNFSLEIKELIEFSLPTLEGGNVTVLTGRVVWVRKVSADPERYRLGLSFINPFRGLSRFLFGFGIPAANHHPETPKKSWWRRLLRR
jgi:hypothetical protein